MFLKLFLYFLLFYNTIIHFFILQLTFVYESSLTTSTDDGIQKSLFINATNPDRETTRPMRKSIAKVSKTSVTHFIVCNLDFKAPSALWICQLFRQPDSKVTLPIGTPSVISISRKLCPTKYDA